MTSIRMKILAMLAIIAGGAIASAGLSLYALWKANDLNTRSSTQGDIALFTERLNSHVVGVVMESRGIYMAAKPQELDGYAKGAEARFPQMRKLVVDLKRLVPPSEHDRMGQIEKAVEDFIAFRTETIRLGREVSSAAANAQGNNDQNRANRKALNDFLVAFVKRNEDAGNALGDEAAAFTKQIEWILPGVLLAALAASLATALLFAQRSIARPLVDLGKIMERLTAGETQVEVPHVARKDEIGTMARAVAVLRQSTEQVAILQAEERESTARRIRQAESMALVVTDVGEVVAAAAAGDFSARLQIEDADQQMQQLIAGINEINAVVDSATTEFAEALQAVAAGDLTSRIETGYRGRFANLKDAINETVDRLSATVRTIQVTASDVGLAAREINLGADDLSKRTEEQASSLEETAATTEELAASVKASAQASKQASTISGEAMRAAEQGGAIAGQAVEAMARIESASKKISDIIRVIDDIAFQTNLLALNAAVEAARAGDAGKGFAVVASEVRTLAQRSGEAAKDISALISSSNAEVNEGVTLVRQAGAALTEILQASQKVAATIADISTASGEQANGIDEMSQAVAHLDEMTQQNAALAEQSAASAASLSSRIGELNTLVAAFKTGHEHEAAPVARPQIVTNDRTPAALRQLAEAAFTQSKVAAPRPPARKVANSRDADAGWEEF
ncbi:methyl-accepting chemotaxis protein [Bosea sp. BK604]|uniref:methyl-accepting chemotaxis protein n=1 Tax=Bosea sp. BK604 TaxID=2512180 RepID=UPI0010435508|nr:methyl-accepting chemotaxis protein [Bosea sp. BK604]TCR65023.1 methyl-accepting chemotaxis protein [Bosea sp. BK604]